MPYVQRYEGQINGIFTNLQEGYAEEWVEDTDPEVVAFLNPPPPPITVVSARQFKLQLLAAGLLDQVDAWVASQPRAVQIAYEYSGSFVRDTPMMETGFAALGFTAEQIDAFFQAASEL